MSEAAKYLGAGLLVLLYVAVMVTAILYLRAGRSTRRPRTPSPTRTTEHR